MLFKMLYNWGLACCLFFLTTFAWCDQLIVEPEMGRAPIIDALNHAEKNIKLVMYGFTDQILMQKFIEQFRAGRDVKIILERKPYKMESENKKAFVSFHKNHLPVQGKINRSLRLIHQKTLLLDDKQAMVMTFNFTHSAFEKKMRNFALIIEDAPRVRAVASRFDADWQHVRDSRTHPDVIMDPRDARAQLVSQINSSQKNILMYAQSISDFKIIGALADAAKRGVSVKILTSQKTNPKSFHYLRHAGVALQTKKKLYIHAKAFAIDDEELILGSINLTKSSLDENRELAIVSHDKKVLQLFTATFTKDWSQQKTIPDKQDKQSLLLHMRKFMKMISERW